MLKFIQQPITSADAQSLIDQMVGELSQEYAAEHMHGVDYESYESDGGIFVVAFHVDKPIGCGGLRPINKNEMELKRVFVEPKSRGKGFSRLILDHLESLAKSLGCQRLCLETGDQQTAAIGLYESSGYEHIDAFGEYRKSPRSVCFAKWLCDS